VRSEFRGPHLDLSAIEVKYAELIAQIGSPRPACFNALGPRFFLSSTMTGIAAMNLYQFPRADRAQTTLVCLDLD
jgi:hypothetical protein